MTQKINDQDINEVTPGCKHEAGLYIVSTPIGNMRDITLRALDVLNTADIIACEDTRVTQKLLTHYGIKTPMVSYNDHNAVKIRPRLLSDIIKGKMIALVSDAGTPLISDPGYKLVHEARAQNLDVYTVPGPCAAIAALSIAGLPTDRFVFEGFLPTKTKARTQQLEKYLYSDASIVFYESARRVTGVIKDIGNILGKKRHIAIIRELTKRFEEVKQGTVESLLAYYDKAGNPKGEVAIIIAPAGEEKTNQDMIDTFIRDALKDHSVKTVVEDVVNIFNISKKQAYSRCLELKNDSKK